MSTVAHERGYGLLLSIDFFFIRQRSWREKRANTVVIFDSGAVRILGANSLSMFRRCKFSFRKRSLSFLRQLKFFLPVIESVLSSFFLKKERRSQPRVELRPRRNPDLSYPISLPYHYTVQYQPAKDRTMRFKDITKTVTNNW